MCWLGFHFSWAGSEIEPMSFYLPTGRGQDDDVLSGGAASTHGAARRSFTGIELRSTVSKSVAWGEREEGEGVPFR